MENYYHEYDKFNVDSQSLTKQNNFRSSLKVARPSFIYLRPIFRILVPGSDYHKDQQHTTTYSPSK